MISLQKAGDRMKIGFIGAGRVGFTLGRHLSDNGYDVTGYYNRNLNAADEAAFFTGTKRFNSIKEITNESDIVFLTVSDRALPLIWEQMKNLNLKDKIICHTSGALSSGIFDGIARYGAYGYSIHPLFAVYSKTESYKEFSKSFITIEGHPKYISYFREMFEKTGHKTAVISSDCKMRYHAAAVFASNFVVGTVSIAEKMLRTCGFTEKESREALGPILMNNCRNIIEAGTEGALTGPAERNDISTVMSHLDVLSEDEKRVYVALSEAVISLAEIKHPEKDYGKLKNVLREER